MKAFFVSIPHSGERVPPETPWLNDLSETTLMYDVDRFVDRLYEPALKALKIPFVKTEWHRYAIDLNRSKDDIDAESVVGAAAPSGKFPRGRGLHWSMTTDGERLMREPMTAELHELLTEKYFEPFHREVRRHYETFKNQSAKTVYHIDAHSMPSVGTREHRDPGETRADVVVSDCKGISCSGTFKDLVMEAYRRQGFKVVLNWPYFGGRVTETYGRPALGQETIQVELNRALYMDEKTKKLKSDELARIQDRLKNALTYVYQNLPGGL